MLRLLFALIAPLLSAAAFCALNVYKTYADFANKTPKTYAHAEFKKWKGEENTVVVFSNGKEDLEIECATIWGFGYNDMIFRVSKDSKYFVKKGGVQINAPMVVMFLDDVVFYDNGLSYLDAIKHGRNQVMLQGMCSAISRDLNSDMAMVPCTAAKWTDEQILLLVNAHPELKDLAGDLESLKKQSGALSAGTFSNEQMKTFVRDFIENKKKKKEERQ